LPRGGSPEHGPTWVAVAGIVHPKDLWQLFRAELTGIDVRADGWDVRGRWFGVVVGATPRTGELRRGQTIPWRVIAAQTVPGERRARADPIEPAVTGGHQSAAVHHDRERRRTRVEHWSAAPPDAGMSLCS
jgi:hypothetical protein